MAVKRIIPFEGVKIGVEYEPGDKRFTGTDHEKIMSVGYGHIQRHIGHDGEALDVYIGPNIETNKRIFRVSQRNPTNPKDFEHKIMAGFTDIDSARQVYLDHMPVEWMEDIEEFNTLALACSRKTAKKKSSLESRVVESVNGLPLIVEIEGPAEAISRNFYFNPETQEAIHRRWDAEGLAPGAAVTQRLIEKDVRPRIQYSHPDDDPEETGLEPAGEMLSIEVNLETKRFKSSALLNHKTKAGLEVAQRFAARDFPDYSIRTRPTCEDQKHLVGLCRPADGMPLLWDFLRPHEMPGIEGSRGSRIIEKKHCHNCTADKPNCDECKQKFSKSIIQSTLSTRFRTLEHAGESRSSGFKTKGARRMNSAILKKIDSMTDPDQIKLYLAGVMDGMAGDTDMPDAEPTPPPEEQKQTDPAGYEKALEAYSKDLAIYFAAYKQRRVQEAAANNRTREAISTPRTQTQEIDRTTALKALGWSEELATEVATQTNAVILQRQLGQRLTALKKEALESKGEFFGHLIHDDKVIPPTALESAIKAASKLKNLDAAGGFLEADLARIAKEAKAEAERPTASEAVAIADAEAGRHRYNDSISVGENLAIYEGVAYVIKALETDMREMDPAGFKRYEKNKGGYEYKALAQRHLKRCIETYGGSLLNFNKKQRAREDANSNGFTNLPNYPAVMTALMVVQQWRRSPVWDLIGNTVGMAMKLGNMIGGNGGPMGQFVELFTETRSQRKVHDAGYIQSASDPQREISVLHSPRQHFAYQETTRIRWDDELDFFLRLAPLMRDPKTRLLFNLMEELDYYTEQRISTEILRSSDAYKSALITGETTNIAKTNCWFYSGPGGITAPDGTVVEDGIGWVWMRRGYPGSTDNPVYGPVVRSGIDPFLQRTTLTFPASFPVNISPINGKTQSRGVYNPTTRRCEKINASDPNPTFFVLWDIGVVVFLEGSKFDATNMPTFTQYNRVDNVSRFSWAANGDETTAAVANRFVELIQRQVSIFGKRQVDNKAGRFLLASESINNEAALSTHFQGQDQLAFARIAGTYEPESDYVTANLRRTRFLSTSEPLYADDKRCVLGIEGMTIYDELMPPVLGDEQQGATIDQNANVVYTSQKSISITRRAIIATVSPRDPLNDDEEINFGYAGTYNTSIPTSADLPI